MPTQRGGSSSTKKRRQRRRRTQKLLQRAVKIQHLKIKELQTSVMQQGKESRFQVKQRRNVCTAKILPEFEYDNNVRAISEALVRELQLTSGELGSGTFGTCHAMWYAGIRVAVKSYHQHHIQAKHILMEANMLGRCAGHPNTPFFFGAIFNGKSSLPSLVMSLHTVGGSPFTLQSLLHHSTNAIHERECAFLLLGVAEGLSHMHSQGVLHNDVKADNVALSDCLPKCKENPTKFWPTIIDFGKACPFNGGKKYTLQRHQRKVFKERYTQLAPDLLDGIVAQSHLSDVYSLGKLIERIASVATNGKELSQLSLQCTAYSCTDRKELRDVTSTLKTIAFI